MPSRQRPPEALDAEHCDGPGPVTDSDAGSPETVKGPTSLAEAEGEAARAESRAKEARARAMRLRRQAETASSDQRDTTDSAEDNDTAAVDDGTEEAAPPSARSGRWRRLRWRRVRRPGRKAVGLGAAIMLISASLGASGYMAWQHRTLVHERQRAAEFAAAARQGVVTFMSIDANHAKEDFQRIIDDSTGQLKDQLEAMAIYLVKNAEDAKVSTKATVDAVAVESMTDNSAVVLVVAKSDTTNPDNTKRPPASWRLSVDIDRAGGQLKMSKVEFVQ
jgi:Mce-associated membrane protein